jgi:hypothetical protein
MKVADAMIKGGVGVGWCDHCGSRFYQTRADHRFCSITCHHEFHIAERRAAVEFFRAQRMSVREGKPDQRKG